MHSSFIHRWNGMDAKEGEGRVIQVWRWGVLESAVEVSQARLFRFNWQGSGFSSVGGKRRPLWFLDSTHWCFVPAHIRIFLILRRRHELEGTRLHNIERLSESNRYVQGNRTNSWCLWPKLWLHIYDSRNLVQAALGPVALDLARSQKVFDKEKHLLAQNVLVISVLAIISTAPLGKWHYKKKATKKSLRDTKKGSQKFKWRFRFLILFPSTGALLMTKLAPRWLKRENPTDGRL